MTPEIPSSPLPEQSPSEYPTRHGYWGPLPGETPELYKKLGVVAYNERVMSPARRLVSLPGDAPEDEKAAFVRTGDREQDLANLIYRTKSNEIAHLTLAGELTGLGVWGELTASPSVQIGIGVVWAITNVLANAYPIMMQRYNRLRAYRILDRMGIPEPKLLKKPKHGTF